MAEPLLDKTGGALASVVGGHGKTAAMHAAERGKNVLYLTQLYTL